MKKIFFIFLLFVMTNNIFAQNTYVIFEKTPYKMGKGKHSNMILQRANPVGYYETLFSFAGSAFSGVQKCRFYTVDRNVFTVIPISQVSQDYPNTLTHAWLANYMKTTPINTAVLHFSALPNIYIIEMLPALGVAHIHRVKYITPYY